MTNKKESTLVLRSNKIQLHEDVIGGVCDFCGDIIWMNGCIEEFLMSHDGGKWEKTCVRMCLCQSCAVDEGV